MTTNDNNDLLSQLKLDKTTNKGSPSSPNYWVWLGVIIIVAILITTYFWRGQNGSSDKSVQSPRSEHAKDSVLSKLPTISSTSEPPQQSPRPNTHGTKILDASGYISARRVATVSAEVMGLITSVDVEEGKYVKHNQILANIDDTTARIDYALAEASITAHESRLEALVIEQAETIRTLERLEKLGNSGTYYSESQLTRARTDRDKLVAQIASAKSDITMSQLTLDRQKNHLEDHVIRAPFSGVITAKNAQAGEIIAPSSAGGGFTRTGICTIVDMGSLEIEVDVNEAFIARVKNDMRVIAKLDAYPDWHIPASVIAIVPTADRAKATVRVRIRIETSDSRILPDMGVKVGFYEN